MLLVCHTANQAVTQPSGWTGLSSSPVSTGTAGAAGGTRLTAYYRWWQSGDAAPTVSVSGGVVSNGIIAAWRGVHPTSPFDGMLGTIQGTASTTLQWSGSGFNTNFNGCVIVLASARDQDLNSTAAVSGYSNANLTGLTEVHDQVVNTSVGGGICLAYGNQASAGAVGTTTATQTSSIACSLAIALRQDAALTLTQSSRFDNTNTFYSPTVTPGSVTLSPGLLTNTSTFYAATITQPGADQSLTQSARFDNAQTFHAPTVTSSYPLSQTARLDNTQTIYQATVSPGAANLSPGLLTNTNTFYAPTVTAGNVLIAPLLSNANAFYAPSVSASNILTQTARLNNTNTFYSPTVTPGSVTLAPGLYQNSNAFYSHSVSPGSVTLSVSLLNNNTVFYSATVSQDGSDQSLFPLLFENTNTFYPAVISLADSNAREPEVIGGAAGYDFLNPKPKPKRKEKKQEKGVSQVNRIKPGIVIDARIEKAGQDRSEIAKPTIAGRQSSIVEQEMFAERIQNEFIKRGILDGLQDAEIADAIMTKKAFEDEEEQIILRFLFEL